jgi:hypothetical protein
VLLQVLREDFDMLIEALNISKVMDTDLILISSLIKILNGFVKLASWYAQLLGVLNIIVQSQYI